MDRKEFTQANREAWNEATLVHQKSRAIDLKKMFAKKGYSTLDELVTAKLKELGITGKKVAQLCCNNGRELLSLINLGAKYGVGFDISDEAIKEAKELREISGLDCRFVRTDVYDIGDEYDGQFDLVFISIGSLTWLPDLPTFFAIVSRILKSGGNLLIYTMHPICNMFGTAEDKEFDSENPVKILFSYFRKEPWIGNAGIDYIGKTMYDSKPNYSYSHTLTDFFNPIIASDFEITEFTEYGHDISDVFKFLEKEAKLPMSLMLVGRKR